MKEIGNVTDTKLDLGLNNSGVITSKVGVVTYKKIKRLEKENKWKSTI